jgi:hypothetical protein
MSMMTIFIVDSVCIYRVFELANSVTKYFHVKACLKFFWTNSDIYNGTIEKLDCNLVSRASK